MHGLVSFTGRTTPTCDVIKNTCDVIERICDIIDLELTFF